MARVDPKTIIDINQDHGLSKKTFEAGRSNRTSTRTTHTFQWIKDKVDTRDYLYKPAGNRMANKVDLRPYCSLIEDQGNLGSCTGQAVAGAIELLNKRNRKPNDVSRLFIYYFEREILGTVNYDSGAYIRDGIKVTNKYGAPLENYWPYIINRYKNRPDDVAIEDGAKRKVLRYERILNHEGCINALNNGYPIIIGFYVYSSFYRIGKNGIMPMPNPRREILLGGHAVLLVGYDMATNRYIARNSWGTNWGDKGYFYMPFDVIRNRNMSDDFWIIKDVNNP